ncbi:sulfurtransferase-like selenium metabolism protein YedF [bacterium]|nr:MAG: sulfurtransferase-like selenium metabolism protein YedF [bacterium]
MGILDLRGLPCPEPVIKTKELLESAGMGVFTVLVDDLAAKENVSRFAANLGCYVNAKEHGEAYEITIVKGLTCETPEQPATMEPAKSAILFLSDTLGENPELGAILMRAFFGALPKATVLPAKLIFLNSSVRLTTEGSPVLEELCALEKLGVEILSCGTCLDFFGKKEALKTGKVTNIFDTIETMTGGYRVTTIS